MKLNRVPTNQPTNSSSLCYDDDDDDDEGKNLYVQRGDDDRVSSFFIVSLMVALFCSLLAIAKKKNPPSRAYVPVQYCTALPCSVTVYRHQNAELIPTNRPADRFVYSIQNIFFFSFLSRFVVIIIIIILTCVNID